MGEARLKHFGWGREGEAMTAEEERSDHASTGHAATRRCVRI
jgi:hypothetical protein